MASKIIKISGEWCKGCNANCELKQPRQHNNHHGSFNDYEELFKHVDKVIEKTLFILESYLK
jgi:hypothetical protein